MAWKRSGVRIPLAPHTRCRPPPNGGGRRIFTRSGQEGAGGVKRPTGENFNESTRDHFPTGSLYGLVVVVERTHVPLPGARNIGSTMIRRLSVLIMSIGLGLALVLAPTASSAEDERSTRIRSTKVLKKVQDLVQPKNVQPPSMRRIRPRPTTTTSPPNETENPVGPDHASTRGIDAGALQDSLLGLNHDNATVKDDDTTSRRLGRAEPAGTNLFGTPRPLRRADDFRVGTNRGLHPRLAVRVSRREQCLRRGALLRVARHQ